MARAWTGLLCLWLVSCTCQPEQVAAPEVPSTPPTSVLLIGADGFACDLAQPMLQAGQLPNIAGLIERGVFGNVKTIKPTKSPVIWTTIATGLGKRKHGIMGFLNRPGKKAQGEDGPEVDPRSERDLVRSTDRKVKALWNIASDAERRVASIGWWVTYPVEPISGVMVAQTNTVRPKRTEKAVLTLKGAVYADHPGQVWPPSRQAQLNQTIHTVEADFDARVSRVFGGPFNRDIGEAWNNMWTGSLWSMRSDAIYHELSLELLREEGPEYDLFMVYFGGTDVLGHRFFRWFKPELYAHRPAPEELAAFQDIIPAYYRELDRMVGELVSAAPEDANIILVSDHGMGAIMTKQPFIGNDPSGTSQSGGHRNAPPACLVAAGPHILRTDTGITPAAHLGSVHMITPTVLALLQLPVGKDMGGRHSKKIIDPAYLAQHPPAVVSSHTPSGWSPEVVEVNTEALGDEERREQLRALGYIE